MQTRQTQRKTLNLPGRYFTGSGVPVDVALTDISVGGCRFKSDSAKLALGTRLQIYIAGSGPHHATIKWVSKGEVGITFTHPLTDEKLDEFKSSHIPDLASNIAAGDFDPMPAGRPQRFC